MAGTLAKKLQVKPGQVVRVLHAPEGLELDLPEAGGEAGAGGAGAGGSAGAPATSTGIPELQLPPPAAMARGSPINCE